MPTVARSWREYSGAKRVGRVPALFIGKGKISLEGKIQSRGSLDRPWGLVEGWSPCPGKRSGGIGAMTKG
jgi:hypothetical protein